MWNEVLRLPVPPVNVPADLTVTHIGTIVFGTGVAVMVLYGLWHARERKGQIILMMMLGAAFASICEPILDVLDACWHPDINQAIAFELMGRKMPVWVIVAYTFYFGTLSTIIFLAFDKGVTRRQVWLWFLLPVVVDMVMEEVMLRSHLYYYYGNQPLRLFGVFSYSWPPVNAMSEFLGVSGAFLLLPYLKGWRALALPLVFMPLADFIGAAAVGLLLFNAVNSEHMSNWLVQVFGITPWPLAAVIVYGISMLVAVDSPLRCGQGVRQNGIGDAS